MATKNKNTKIEMVKGGKMVDDKHFVPTGTKGDTIDNRITNAKVDAGELPESQRVPFEPRVSAPSLVNPRTAPELTPPTQPSINQNTLRTVGNVAKNVGGIIEADTAENARLKALREEQSAFGFSGADLFAEQMESSGTNANLQELKDINLQLADMQTKSDLRKVDIAGAGGQTLDQGLRELTQEDREEAVRQTGLAARAAVLTDNIDTATALARDAVTFAFQDASLELSNRANQINDLRDVVDGQTQQLLDAELRAIEAEQERIKEVKTAIQGAILAGASQADMDIMLSPETPDEEKLAIAQRVQAESARTDIGLDRAAKGASIRASNASAALNELQLRKEQAIQEAVDSGAIVLNEDQQKTAMSLGKQFEDESKMFKTQVDAFNRILASADNPSAAGDLSLIFAYMKMLDPTSVVRETEFANAQNAAGVPEQLRAQYNRIRSGERLTDATRKDFIDRSMSIYSSALDQQVQLEDQYRTQATDIYGLPPQAADLIIRDIRSAGAATSEVVFSTLLNQADDDQLRQLQEQGLLPMQSFLPVN